MFGKKEIDFSTDFGEEYVDEIISCLAKEYDVTFKKKTYLDPELIFWDYTVNGKTITIMSEGMIGTSFIGGKRIVEEIILFLKRNNF